MIQPTKEKQLRKYFRRLMYKLIGDAGGFYPDFLIDECANKLIKKAIEVIK